MKVINVNYEKGAELLARSIARNFKSAGIPINIIAENTGLTEDEVKKL